MNKPELLSPAGGGERLDFALHYGADAVYLAGNAFSLRAFADNFDDAELVDAIKKVHNLNKKAYVTVNIYAHHNDIAPLRDYLLYLQSIGADAVIVSDLGVVSLCRETCPGLPVHISTQASITNYRAANVAYSLGASRIVLAREVSVDEIRLMREKIPDDLELEAFVHGAMCISYSGRCLLSNYLTGRGANQGMCAQPCRWQYEVREVNRNDWLPVEEDERGTYIFNSRDLCMISHLQELYRAGVTSFKVEGRMKTAYYAAVVTGAYRRAIDDMMAGKTFNSELENEVARAANRSFTTGFYYGKPDDTAQRYESSKCIQSCEFVGVVRGRDERGLIVEQRNKFSVGESIGILSPQGELNRHFTVTGIMDYNTGEEMHCAPNPQQMLIIPCKCSASPMDILRRDNE